MGFSGPQDSRSNEAATSRPSETCARVGADLYCIGTECEAITREASTEFKDAVVALHSLDWRAWFNWFLQSTLIYLCLMVPTVTLKVTDRINPSLAPSVVANVPLGLGVIASFTSQIGDYLTREAETVFVMPAQLPFGRTRSPLAILAQCEMSPSAGIAIRRLGSSQWSRCAICAVNRGPQCDRTPPRPRRADCQGAHSFPRVGHPRGSADRAARR